MKFVKMAVLILSLCPFLAYAGDDPLPSWNEGPAKNRIMQFVAQVSTKGSEKFVAENERIAVFDN